MKKIKILLLLFIMMFTINVHAVEFDLNSNNAILYNLNDNSVLYEKSSQEKTSIASMTKIMTAIVAIENIDNLDAKVKLTYADFSGLAAANASVAGFRSGEEVTYRDLLYGLMLPSGADAAQSLARNVSGTVDGFVALMNMKVAELGCSNTHFVNTTGLDHVEHYSTVEDVAKIFQYAIKNKDFLEIVKSKTYTTSNGRLTFKSTIERAKSRYGLSMDYVLGGKTGTTGDAGYCLATIANYNGVDYMLVTAKTIFPSSKPLNYLDAKTIYEYFMNNYSYKNVLSEKDKLVSIKTKYAKNDKVDFYANKELDMYLENTYKKEELIYKYSGIEEIPYDMEKGTKLGKVEVFDKETLLTTVDIVLEEEQEFDLMKYIKANKLQVGGIILVIVLLLAIIIRLIFRKKRKRKVRRN